MTDGVFEKRENSLHVDNDLKTWVGVIPNNTNIDSKGGWRWDAFCLGTRVDGKTRGSLEYCRLRIDEANDKQNACIQYKGDDRTCFLFENCST